MQRSRHGGTKENRAIGVEPMCLLGTRQTVYGPETTQSFVSKEMSRNRLDTAKIMLLSRKVRCFLNRILVGGE